MDQILKKSLEKIGIEITDEQKEQFDTYHKLLEEWNKVMNLTGITEYEEVVEKHYVDSLSIVKVMDMKSWGWKISTQFMEEQKIMPKMQHIEKSMICVYPEQLQIWRH